MFARLAVMRQSQRISYAREFISAHEPLDAMQEQARDERATYGWRGTSRAVSAR
jgi:hypothetical protein